MSFFKSFFGGNIETHQKRAQEYMASGLWGEARLELDKALRKLKDPKDPRLEEIKRTLAEITHRLARAHEEEGDHLRDSGLHDEASERYGLALSLMEEEKDRERLQNKLSPQAGTACSTAEATSLFLQGSCCGASTECSTPAPASLQGDPMEYFDVLMNTLDADLAEELRSLGEDFALGYAYANHGDYEKAIGYYEKASQSHPGNKTVHKEFGRTLLFHKEPGRAVEELTLARDGVDNDLELLHLLASAHIEGGAIPSGAKVFQEAQAAYPDDIESHLILGDAYFRSGQMAEAGNAYKEALKIAPEFPETLGRLGAWAVKQGEETLAVEYYSKAAENGKNLQDTLVLAELYIKDDRDLEGAAALLLKAVYQDPANRWRYMLRIGEIYLKSGMESKAREVLNQTRGIIPEDQPEVLDKLNQFLQA